MCLLQDKILIFQCDLRNEAEIRSLFEWILQEFGRIDVCISNAGLSSNKSLLEGTSKEWQEMWQVNVFALQLSTQLAIKSMLKSKVHDGQIIMINSVAGHRVANRVHSQTRFYSATKFAVSALLEGWRTELKDIGDGNAIRVAQVSPGLVESEFALAMNNHDEEKAKKAYANKECLQPKNIAECIKFILEAPPSMQINDIILRPTEQRL